ncbi:MAG: ERCC4 domain-containing protein [Candidatus Bathyarchaeia archaeon]
MSGTESLIPFIREPSQGEQPVILVDSREASAAPKIVKGLREAGVEVRVLPLTKGDYVVSDRCAIERKTIMDFVHTLTRRYLFEQLFTLRDAYRQSILVLEGYLPIIYKFSKIRPQSVWGAIFALAGQGIPVVPTTNWRETVDFLQTAAKQEQIVEKRAPSLRPVKKAETVLDRQLFFLEGLPLVGHEKAVALLKAFKTPMNALQSLDRWGEIHRFGPAVADRVREVLYTSYEEGDP